MKKSFFKLFVSFCLIYSLGSAVSHSSTNAKAGWAIGAAIAYTAGADDGQANMAGDVVAAGLGSAGAYAGAEAGAVAGSVGGPLGAFIGGALGFL